jgi:hypothetical protein
MTASQFVLVYDVAAGAVVDVQRFDDPEAAAAVVLALEEHHRGDVGIHVVMLTSESLESLRATHGTYFGTTDDLVGSLADAVAA